MKIGLSVVDITPDIGTELEGYGWFLGRKAVRVLDKLYARAVAFEQNNKYLLLINCDLIVVRKSVSETVKQRLSDEIGIDKSNIMILATHTHTGPSVGESIGCGETDENYLASLPEFLVNAGKMAFGKFREVKQAKNIIKSIDPIGFNRARPDGPVDSLLCGILFYFEEGRPFAVLSHGCHPVTLGPAGDISADYPGRVIKALNENGIDGVFLNGFCGDIDPVSNREEWGSGTEETINEYGRRIAEAFTDGICKSKPLTDNNIDAFEIEVKLNLQKYGLEEINKYLDYYTEKKESDPGLFKVVQIWAKKTKKQIEENTDPYHEFLTVQVFVIGDVAFAGFPGEIFTLIGMNIKKALPDINIITLGNANNSTRYITTRDDVENCGYSGFISCFCDANLPLEPGEGERMADTVSAALKDWYKSHIIK